MKSITYFLCCFSVGYTAHCIAMHNGMPTSVFFLGGFAVSAYTLGNIITARRQLDR